MLFPYDLKVAKSEYGGIEDLKKRLNKNSIIKNIDFLEISEFFFFQFDILFLFIRTLQARQKLPELTESRGRKEIMKDSS